MQNNKLIILHPRSFCAIDISVGRINVTERTNGKIRKRNVYNM